MQNKTSQGILHVKKCKANTQAQVHRRLVLYKIRFLRFFSAEETSTKCFLHNLLFECGSCYALCESNKRFADSFFAPLQVPVQMKNALNEVPAAIRRLQDAQEFLSCFLQAQLNFTAQSCNP